jgi:DNA-binding transcriptional ArsR family regulator
VATYELTLTALADPMRRRVLDRLKKRPRSVNEIVRALPISQPAVSQHLRILQDANLVAVKAEGNKRIYSIKREGLEDVRGYIEGFWDDALDRFALEAEAAARRKGK